MTDEEMAEEYAKGLCKTCTVDTCRYSTIQTCAIKEYLKQAYLAGLKANNEREKDAKSLLARWIDTRPYTVSEQKDLIADTEQFLSEVEN